MSNEKNLTPELLEKAKSASSAAALLVLAQEGGTTLTAEEATDYYTQLHPKAGALSDEELDNVAGGCGGQTTTKDLALAYAQEKYCGKNPRCIAHQVKNPRESNLYLSIPANQGKLCYCCNCKTSIDAYCKSMGWPILEVAPRM